MEDSTCRAWPSSIGDGGAILEADAKAAIDKEDLSADTGGLITCKIK